MKAVINGLESYISGFADKICRTIEDMTGIQYTIDKNTLLDTTFSSGRGMIVFIPFSGTVQGNCIIALEEEAALRLIGAYKENIGEEELLSIRPDTADVIKEILNIAMGQFIVHLEVDFGLLSYTSAIVVFGDIIFPKVSSGTVVIEGAPGNIQCAFSLDMVDLKIARKLKCVTEDLAQKNKLAYMDGLTSLYNRFYFNQIFEKEIENSKASGKNLSVLFIDVDYFKSFNDIYGHQVGDLVLSAVSGIIMNTIRTEDIPCRYGGDEMIILLPDTNLAQGEHAADRIKKAMQKLKIDECIMIPRKEHLSITLSIGVTQLRAEDSSKDFFARVDSALYDAKEGGRDMIVVK